MDFDFSEKLIALEKKFPKKFKQTNQVYNKACEVANITGTKANRWLRDCKNYEWAVNRALNELKELKPNNRVAYFQWLLKKYKGEQKNEQKSNT